MVRFVTTLNAKYLPGFHALLQSMRENSGVDFRFSVACYQDPAEFFPLGDSEVDEVFHIYDLGEPLKVESRTKRMVINLGKPLLWRMSYDHPLVYIDSDMLCMSSLKGIEDFDELTCVKMASQIGKKPDTDPTFQPSGINPWNAGWYVFRPSEETFQGIKSQSEKYRSPIAYGDQVVVNDYFNREKPEIVNQVDMEWNMSTFVCNTYLNQAKSGFDVPVRIMHFAHPEKPWLHDPRPFQEPFWEMWDGYHKRYHEAIAPSRIEAFRTVGQAMIQVKLKVSRSGRKDGESFTQRPGEIIWVGEGEGQRLIEQNKAVAIAEPETHHGTAKKRRKSKTVGG